MLHDVENISLKHFGNLFLVGIAILEQSFHKLGVGKG
jgi:hypothetical protein